MLEIAATFAAARLPDGFHQAAAEVYRRMFNLKEVDAVDIGQVVKSLLQHDG